MTISAIYKAIVTKTKRLANEYNKRINNNQKHRPTLIDQKVFKKAGSKLTYYAINKTIAK